jgi:hypothetical protein
MAKQPQASSAEQFSGPELQPNISFRTLAGRKLFAANTLRHAPSSWPIPHRAHRRGIIRMSSPPRGRPSATVRIEAN